MIKVGQLVRIKRFGYLDAVHRNGVFEKHLIGQTGRFIEWRPESNIPDDVPSPYSVDGKSWAGDFEFDPDPMEQNELMPTFSSVYVEPVEEQNERE